MSNEKFAKKKNPLVVNLDAKGGPKFVKGTGVPLENKEPKESKKASKPAKAAKAPKVEKEEKAPDNRKIKLLTKENPKREGTAAHDRYELYRDSKTVEAFLEAGGRTADLRYDEQKGYIEVA